MMQSYLIRQPNPNHRKNFSVQDVFVHFSLCNR